MRRSPSGRHWSTRSRSSSPGHRSSCRPGSRPSIPTSWPSNKRLNQLQQVDDDRDRAQPGPAPVGVPHPWFLAAQQHQDREQHRHGGALDGVGDELAVGGDQRRHQSIELHVLQGEPEGGGDRVQRLEAEEPRENERLAQARVQAAWEHHSSYSFIKDWCAEPNATQPLPARDRSELVAIYSAAWSGSLAIRRRTLPTIGSEPPGSRLCRSTFVSVTRSSRITSTSRATNSSPG